MRGGFLVALAALGGCGRIAFDRSSDAGACAAPAGHDEDGDSIDDACDVCPQLPDEQLDSDGDGVGDACDLQATREQRLLFDPFTGRRADWSYQSEVVFNADSITMPGIGDATLIWPPGSPGRAVLEIGGRIAAVPPDATRQVSLHIGELAGSANYYCELYEVAGSFELKLSHNDGMSYTTLGRADIGGSVAANDAFRIVFEHTPPSLRCVAWWNGVRYDASGTDPGDILVEEMYIVAANVDAEVTYFVQLAAP